MFTTIVLVQSSVVHITSLSTRFIHSYFTWISEWASVFLWWWPRAQNSRGGRRECSSWCWTMWWKRDRKRIWTWAGQPVWYPPRTRRHTAPPANPPAPWELCWRRSGMQCHFHLFHWLESLDVILSLPLLQHTDQYCTITAHIIFPCLIIFQVIKLDYEIPRIYFYSSSTHFSAAPTVFSIHILFWAPTLSASRDFEKNLI